MRSSVNVKLNTALTQARKHHCWSQEEVAAMIGTTQANLSRWERGITSPAPHYTRKLCELYQKSSEELFPRVFHQRWDEDRPVFLCNGFNRSQRVLWQEAGSTYVASPSAYRSVHIHYRPSQNGQDLAASLPMPGCQGRMGK